MQSIKVVAMRQMLKYTFNMKKFTLIFVAAFSMPAMAGNLATCLLDKAPGVQNDRAANAVAILCLERYPYGIDDVPQGSGRWLFSFKSGAECVVKKGSDTRSRAAARLIATACHRLYDSRHE